MQATEYCVQTGVNTVFDDALAPCDARSSAVMIFMMNVSHVLIQD